MKGRVECCLRLYIPSRCMPDGLYMFFERADHMLKICFCFSKPEIASWYPFQEQFQFAKRQNIHFQKCFPLLIHNVTTFSISLFSSSCHAVTSSCIKG